MYFSFVCLSFRNWTPYHFTMKNDFEFIVRLDRIIIRFVLEPDN